MRKIVLLSLLVAAWAASDLLPEEATERFYKSMEKHFKVCNMDILEKDFYIESPGKNNTHQESIAIVQKACLTHKPDDSKDNTTKISVFTDDGLLNIKEYDENKALKYSVLAKPNKNIEGGYKLYKIHIM